MESSPETLTAQGMQRIHRTFTLAVDRRVSNERKAWKTLNTPKLETQFHGEMSLLGQSPLGTSRADKTPRSTAG